MRIYVGVLYVELQVPGARTRKDRRQVIRSLRDRCLHRFDLTFHLLDDSPHPTRQAAVLTTGGNDGGHVRAILDQVRSFLESQPGSWPSRVDVDVFRWHPPEGQWAAPGRWGDLDEEDSDG